MSRELVLEQGEVCGKCNRDNGRLDDHLQTALGVLRVYLNPVGSKSGRPVTVNMPGVRVERRGNDITFTLNAESYTIVNPEGAYVGPAKQKPHAARAARPVIRGDGTASTVFTHTVRFNKKALRALHKIAFELLCLEVGPDALLARRFDWIRDYVLHGRGQRRVLAIAPQTTDLASIQPQFIVTAVRSDWVVTLQLGMVFVIDLSPDNHLTPREVADEDRCQILGGSDEL